MSSSVWVVEMYYSRTMGWWPVSLGGELRFIYQDEADAEKEASERRKSFRNVKYRVRRYDRVPDRARRKR